MRPRAADWKNSGGAGVLSPAPPSTQGERNRDLEDLDGWPPRGWDDGGGGGDDGGGGGGGDGWRHDPWDDLPRPGTAELALMLGLICVGVLFLIFCGIALLSAYNAAQWPPPGAPHPPDGLLASTLLLLGSSVALASGLSALRRGSRKVALRRTWTATGMGGAFLVVQAWLWSELIRSDASGANAYVGFFYLLTGLHALHVAGGLVFLGRTLALLRRERCLTALRLTATYWHAMGVIWVAVFAILYLVR